MRPITKSSNSESSLLLSRLQVPDSPPPKCQQLHHQAEAGNHAADSIRIEKLERENAYLMELLKQIGFVCRKQLDHISQLENANSKQLEHNFQLEIANECLREQRAILLAPTPKFPRRQKMSDFVSGDLETISEDQILSLCLIDNRYQFEEMRRAKRQHQKRKFTVKKYIS